MKKSLMVLFLLCICISLFASCGSDGGASSAEDLDYYSLLKPVDSTCFSEVGYDSSNETLVVEFLDSGSIYAYYNVPKSEYKDLVGADSIGGYYNTSIKGQYKSQRLE